jgi:hypothetical protein
MIERDLSRAKTLQIKVDRVIYLAFITMTSAAVPKDPSPMTSSGHTSHSEDSGTFTGEIPDRMVGRARLKTEEFATICKSPDQWVRW